MSDPEKTEKYRRTIGIGRIIIAVLVLAVIALAIAFGLVATRLHTKLESKSENCPLRGNQLNLDPPEHLPPFHDLTVNELKAVRDYLHAQPDLMLAHADMIRCNNNYIFTIDLQVPNKEETLNFLDKGHAAPVREAHVFLFMGGHKQPYVQEYIVGPLPNPTYKKAPEHRSFLYRPLTHPEMVGAIDILHREVTEKISNILLESYGGKIGNCEDNCLEFQMISPMSSTATGEPMSRKMWFWLSPVVEFWSLHPLDFTVLMDLTSNKVEEYTISKITYGNQMFQSLEDLQSAYKSGSVIKTKISFPKRSKQLFSSMNRRGKLFPHEQLSPPIEFEPKGKRYSINGRHIQYMGWDFDLRMSTTSGPQLFDIRYNNERIVYELSLQDIAVFYSAHNPAVRFADYVDSVALIGMRVRSLVSGGDCPEHSTYLSADHMIEISEDPVHIDRAFCVFEHNTGNPLRRHLSSDGERFYEGMMDIVLTIRTVATVINYDYVFDFIFHQNGAVEVKVISTGYILTSFRFETEDNYGFRLRDHMTGNLHHHMFNFKVDMDIHGTKNRFETLEITPVEVDSSMWSKNKLARYSQTKLTRKVIQTEKEAAMKHRFDAPKYLTFYNNGVLSPSGVPRSYRLLTRGISKQMFAEGKGQEPSVSWGRYQVAVTKYKEQERRSSSFYACWDAEDPVVNFQSFIDDNETIVDVDQVTWVTIGIHHIPHMEDIPVTPTVGLDLGFFLLPYNYFDEDPGMGSSDAVRIEPNNPHNLEDGVTVERYGNPANPQCLPQEFTFSQDVQKNPYSLFNTNMDDENI